MSKIFSSLSNASGDLDELKNEFGDLYNFFGDKVVKEKVDHKILLNDNIDQITSALIAAQKDLRLFHFSGHSGKKGLDFPEEDFTSDHVIRFFNTLGSNQNLQCVFLNGCENEEIVKQLLRVPVVIGTRSKIEDSVARKFTGDFFSSLILGGNSYEQAFDTAVSGLNLSSSKVTRTRSEGGDGPAEEKKILNDYFILINRPEVAKGKFPVQRGKTNWIKYLVFFFFAVAAFLLWLKWDDISKKFKDYDCSPISIVSDKCNFVIGDFTSDTNIEFGEWLYENVKTASLIKAYLHPIYLGSFNTMILDSKIDRDSLPSLCGYDFNLTGSLSHEGNNLRAELNIFPFDPRTAEVGSFPYVVSSLGKLDTLISAYDSSETNQFILYDMCVRCALKKDMPNLKVILKTMAESIDPTKSSVDYQKLFSDLANVNLRYADTSAAILALNKVSQAVGNDIALSAIERKIELYSAGNNFLNVFETQSDLITELSARHQSPAKYQLRSGIGQYQTGENNVRLDRATLVLAHKDDKLQPYISTAIQDFEYLQNIKFQGKDYSNEIKQLKDSQVLPPAQFHLRGVVINPDGQGLRGATVSFNAISKITDGDGWFDFGLIPKSEIAGKSLQISMPGFQKATARIRAENLIRIMLKPNPASLVDIQAVRVTENGYQQVILSLESAGYKVNKETSMILSAPPENFARTSTVFYSGEKNKAIAEKLAGQMKKWTSESFAVQLSGTASMARKPGKVLSDVTIQWVGINKSVQVFGGIIDEKNRALEGATVRFEDWTKTTDSNGQFDFGQHPETDVFGKTLFISRDGFQELSYTIDVIPLEKIKLERISTGEVLDKYSVIIQAVQVKEMLYSKVLSSLKSAGYPISSRLSKNYPDRPDVFESKSTVIFYHPGNEERANVLAREMTTWTHTKFDAKLMPLPKSIAGTSVAKEAIVIQWLGAD